MAPQPAGAAPIQPFPTLTVQTFLYPGKTIKPNSTERSLGNSLQREQEGCCQNSRKRRRLLRTPRPPSMQCISPHKDDVFSVVWEGWMDVPHLCYCPSACPPLQKIHCCSFTPPTSRRAPHDGKQTFHLIYFISNVKFAISHGHSWLLLATTHHFTLDPKFYWPRKWCTPAGKVVSNGCVRACTCAFPLQPIVLPQNIRRKTFFPTSTSTRAHTKVST